MTATVIAPGPAWDRCRCGGRSVLMREDTGRVVVRMVHRPGCPDNPQPPKVPWWRRRAA